MKRPELLSPAGDREKLETALMYGADAVYLAGEQFGMRAAATNFSNDAMLTAVSHAHAAGVKVYVTTADGSEGIRGFVTDAFDNVDYSYFYTCGPEPMLKAVYDRSVTSGQFSFEERMGCGFGACMGCSCKTKYGNKRICRDGPVLCKEEIIW